MFLWVIAASRLHCSGCTVNNLITRFNLKLSRSWDRLSAIETAKRAAFSIIQRPSHFLLIAMHGLHHMVRHLLVTKLGKQRLLELNWCMVRQDLEFLRWLACDGRRYVWIIIFRAISCIVDILVIWIDLLGLRVQKMRHFVFASNILCYAEPAADQRLRGSYIASKTFLWWRISEISGVGCSVTALVLIWGTTIANLVLGRHQYVLCRLLFWYKTWMSYLALPLLLHWLRIYHETSEVFLIIQYLSVNFRAEMSLTNMTI